MEEEGLGPKAQGIEGETRVKTRHVVDENFLSGIRD
jgi:hypothetical protein